MHLALLLCVTLADDVPADPSGGEGGKYGTLTEQAIEVGGRERQYRLFAPKPDKANTPQALVYVFHGRGGDGNRIARYCGFDALARKERFLVVYPSAVDGNWMLRGNDSFDLEFFDALHRRLCEQYGVDRNRVYATGMSMGGYFSNFLASQRSQVIAAIAPHSGGPGVLAFAGVKAPRKYPVLVVHGVDDRIVPIGEGARTKDIYERAGHEVLYRTIENLGHRWATKEGITDEIWQFFVEHPKAANPKE